MRVHKRDGPWQPSPAAFMAASAHSPLSGKMFARRTLLCRPSEVPAQGYASGASKGLAALGAAVARRFCILPVALSGCSQVRSLARLPARRWAWNPDRVCLHIDHAALSEDGGRAFAVQGDPGSPAQKIAHPVDSALAVQTSIVQNTDSMARVNQQQAQAQAPTATLNALEAQPQRSATPLSR